MVFHEVNNELAKRSCGKSYAIQQRCTARKAGFCLCAVCFILLIPSLIRCSSCCISSNRSRNEEKLSIENSMTTISLVLVLLLFSLLFSFIHTYHRSKQTLRLQLYAVALYHLYLSRFPDSHAIKTHIFDTFVCTT